MPMFDNFRRAFGIPTSVELGEARRARDILERSEIPQDKFARAVADVISHMPAHEAERALPALRGKQWPQEEEMRWTMAAHTAREVAEESILKPVPHVDSSLSKAIGEGALLQAAERFTKLAQYRLEPQDNAQSVLDESRHSVAHHVHSFMSTGHAAEHNARHQAITMNAAPGQREWYDLRRDVEGLVGQPTSSTMREWTLEAARTRIAMAQTGVLSPGRTVRAAMDAAGQGHQIHGPIAQTPNRLAASQLQGEERLALIRKQMDKNAQQASPPKPEISSPGELLSRQAPGIKPESIGKSDRAHIQHRLNDPSQER